MSKKLTTNEFIERAKAIHGNKYDYSKVVYIDAHTKVCIICPEHGEFYQNPFDHLTGYGCIKCGRQKTIIKQRKKIEKFVIEAKRVHGDKYDYSKVEYKNQYIKINIICKKHGSFFQTPKSHLSGSGCPICNESKLEKNVCVILKNNFYLRIPMPRKYPQ